MKNKYFKAKGREEMDYGATGSAYLISKHGKIYQNYQSQSAIILNPFIKKST